jgi:DNA-directed RNA polymerase subunit RPC12/RpoP
MGLKCSLLGHAFEPADVEREREEQGSEVVTVVRELERCTRCGAERVVSESTEVTAVVDPEDVGLDEESTTSPADSTPAGGASEADAPEGDADGATGAFDGVVERSGAADDDDGETASDASDGWSSTDDASEPPAADEESEFEARNPEEEDAEILTDDGEPERAPGQWPDDPDDEPWDPESDSVVDDPDSEATEREDLSPDPEEELSGITVPEGVLVCDDCGFQVDSESAYRDGDPCPECGSWLHIEGE